MFQLPDLSMMYCAIATVSAAVGYRYTRRRRRGEPNRCVYQGPGPLHPCPPAHRIRSVSNTPDRRVPKGDLPRRRDSSVSEVPSDVSATSEFEGSDYSMTDSTTSQTVR